MAYRVFNIATAERVGGGLVGYSATEAISGGVSGAMGLEGGNRAAASIITKIVWGLGMLGAAEWADHDHASPFLEGMAIIPICTIPDDVARGLSEASPIQDMAHAWALNWRAKSQAGKAARSVGVPGAPAIGPSTAPGRRLLRASIPFRGGR